MYKLFPFGSPDILVEIVETQDQQRLEELAIELGPIDVQPGEFYADVLAVVASGVEYPEEFAAAALGFVRGAETVNAMIARSRRDLIQSGLLPEPIVPSDDMVSDEIAIDLPNRLYPPASADRLPRRWF